MDISYIINKASRVFLSRSPAVRQPLTKMRQVSSSALAASSRSSGRRLRTTALTTVNTSSAVSWGTTSHLAISCFGTYLELRDAASLRGMNSTSRDLQIKLSLVKFNKIVIFIYWHDRWKLIDGLCMYVYDCYKTLLSARYYYVTMSVSWKQNKIIKTITIPQNM